MLKRAITGFLFIDAIVAGIYFDAKIALCLFSLIVVLGIDEFYEITKKKKEIKPLKFWGTLTGITLMIILCLVVLDVASNKLIFIPLIMFFLTFLIELYRNKNNPFINISYTLIGIIYIVIPFVMLFHLGYYNDNGFGNEYSFQVILGFFILLWTNDTGAYLAGRFFGKRKLFERISPNKTWEGSIGGGIITIGGAFVLSIFFINMDQTNWIVMAVIIAIGGGLGDLIESMLKRSMGVKDSGKLLPGHGGILDRFDGLLLSVPFVYTYLQLIS